MYTLSSVSPKAVTPGREALPPTFTYSEARAAGISAERLYPYRSQGLIDQVARGLYRWAMRPQSISDVAWEALRRWIARKGSKPASLLKMAKRVHGAETAVRSALEIVL
jgi:hypothetical protein